MIRRYSSHPLYPFFRFLIVSTLLYLAWYFTYELYLKPHSDFDEWVVDHLVKATEGLMSIFNYPITVYDDGLWRNHVGILGTAGVTVGAPCDGIVLFALFVVFVIAYPGPWKHRLWFIPLGLLAIHYLNVLRVFALVLLVEKGEAVWAFNHDYTFTVLVYAFVCALWWIWIKRFSTMNIGTKTQS